ncbi:hypothetical protein HK105_208230 [Polyrhizophydium stewartii]|uniref:Wbp11/ELF5/Saf1 N-terminal domain-containing protein n=1 Tax=Polyrhizophydium stewartii TaxID=2732419 RepID=A0ABR4MYG1_9FUNG
MGKKEINPADALRKKLRKQEIKKACDIPAPRAFGAGVQNKEDKKRSQLIALAQRNTGKLEKEFRELKQQELDSELDANGFFKLRKIQQRMDEINDARKQLGLAPKQLAFDASEKAKGEQDKEYRFFHPTFNPHGKRRSDLKDESQTDGEVKDHAPDSNPDSDGSGPDADGAEQPAVMDLSFIPIPQGEAPETDAQVYMTLQLPEVLDTAEANRRAEEAKVSADEALAAEREMAAVKTAQEQAAANMLAASQTYYAAGLPVGVPIGAPIGMPMGHPAAMHMMMPDGAMPGFGVPMQPMWAGGLNSIGAPGTSAPGGGVRHRHSAPAKQGRLPAKTASKPASQPVKPLTLPNKPAQAPVIAAAPQIRDLRKELTSLVPVALLRKKATAQQHSKQQQPQQQQQRPQSPQGE